MSRYEKLPTDGFKHMTFGAGIVTSTFEPSTGAIDPTNILFATKGGNALAVTREMIDMGADLDNCPEGTKQLQKAKPYQINLTGTGVDINKEILGRMLSIKDSTVSPGIDKIELSNLIDLTEYKDIWLVLNYSEYNGETKGGFMAVHLLNTLSVDGFNATFKKDANGEFPYKFQAFYDMENIDAVPVEFYLKAGTAEA